VALGGLAILWVGGLTGLLSRQSLHALWRALVVGALLLGLGADLLYRRALWARRYRRGNRFMTRQSARWTVLVSGVALMGAGVFFLAQLLS
jgi:hypothetical protein